MCNLSHTICAMEMNDTLYRCKLDYIFQCTYKSLYSTLCKASQSDWSLVISRKLLTFLRAISDIPYQGDFPLNGPRVGQVIIALDGLIGLVELPGDGSVGEQDDRTWDQGTQDGQSHNERRAI